MCKRYYNILNNVYYKNQNMAVCVPGGRAAAVSVWRFGVDCAQTQLRAGLLVSGDCEKTDRTAGIELSDGSVQKID